MPAVYLCYWNLRRLFRNRALLLTVVVLPAVAALLCGEWFANSGSARWIVLALMAVFSAVLVQWQTTADSARGFTRLTQSVSGYRWLVESAVLGSFTVVMVSEMGVFVLIRRLVY